MLTDESNGYLGRRYIHPTLPLLNSEEVCRSRTRELTSHFLGESSTTGTFRLVQPRPITGLRVDSYTEHITKKRYSRGDFCRPLKSVVPPITKSSVSERVEETVGGRGRISFYGSLFACLIKLDLNL